jgi:hypothetical protein
VKTVAVIRDISVRIHAKVFVQYVAGVEYKRVPEAQVRTILAAGAGVIVKGAAE